MVDYAFALFSGIFLSIAGLIIGLGAVTVIDWHGFLARHSSYWTEATIRSHRITKPLVWVGTLLCIFGLGILRFAYPMNLYLKLIHFTITILILNGMYLSLIISPKLEELEKAGKAHVLLPKKLQQMIMISSVISFVGWWWYVVLFSMYITSFLR